MSVFYFMGSFCYGELSKKSCRVEREISLDYLMSERYFDPSAMDSYFEKRDKPTVFLVLGKEVVVDDERLAMALSRLPHYTAYIKYLSMYKGHIKPLRRA